MQDRPNAGELLEALAEFMRERSEAATDRFDRFQFLVAANTLGILQRELSLGDEFDAQEWRGLDGLLGFEDAPARTGDRTTMLANRNQKLCDRIERGEFDGPAEETLLLHLYQTTVNKVLIGNPREAT